jgi:hypothetical protein
MAGKGCGKLTKGSHPKDDLIACGTVCRFIHDKKTVTEKIHLCSDCKKSACTA